MIGVTRLNLHFMLIFMHQNGNRMRQVHECASGFNNEDSLTEEELNSYTTIKFWGRLPQPGGT